MKPQRPLASISFSRDFDAAPIAATARPESTSDNPRRWFVIAYGVVVCIATIAWFYLLVLTMLQAVEGALSF
jgi:hypothetical protein